MGDGCQPKNLVAITRAGNQIQGDIFSEAERVKNFSGEQRFYYEKVMANHFGIKPKQAKQKSAWDALKKRKEPKGKIEKLKAAYEVASDGRLYDNPSVIFSKKFYGSIDRKISVWEKTKAKTGQSYQDAVGKPVKGLIKAIDAEVIAAKNKADMTRRLAKYGLDADNIYHAKKYLEWLSNGGHTQVESHPLFKGLNTGANNIAKTQASFNMLWTLGNGVEIQKAYSHYLTRKPASVVNVVKGTLDAITATKGQPWRRVPALEKAGVYGTLEPGQGGKNITPFELSVTAQKNLVYHLDKASGGNGTDGIRNLLFESKPWDVPAWQMIHPDARTLVFGLARYPINESRWLVKTALAAKKDPRELLNLTIYGLSRAFWAGSSSIIPSYLLNKDQKEWFSAQDEKYNLNQVAKISREVFKSVGVEAELNLSEYLSPLGGKLGSRAGSLTTTGEKTFRNVSQGATDLVQGNIPAAGVRVVGAFSAAVNLFLGEGSTQFTDLMDTTAKNMEGEFKTEERFKREAAKDLFGTAVKKTDDKNGLPKLPELPKLPAIK